MQRWPEGKRMADGGWRIADSETWRPPDRLSRNYPLSAIRFLPQQLLGIESEPLDRRDYARPLLLQETLPFALGKLRARARRDEHAAATSFLDEALVDELLVTLQDRERIEREFRGDVAHGREGVTVGQCPFQDHVHHFVAKLAVDRLTVVPV